GATVNSVDGTVDADTLAGPVQLTATNTTESIVSGTASSKANSVGVGASFGINVTRNDTRAELQDGSTLGSGQDLTLAATGSNATATQASGGVASQDGTAVGGAFAITVANDSTTTRVGTGTPVVVTGAVSTTATHHGASSTTADGTALGANSAVGAAIA